MSLCRSAEDAQFFLIFFSNLTNLLQFSTIAVFCLRRGGASVRPPQGSKEVHRMKEKLRLTQMTTAAG